MNKKYQELVYQLVAKIPLGKVMTYGQIAKVLKIKSPRLVGQILHQNQDSKKIPCHRVVFADGSLSTSYAFGGEIRQKEKLRKEGITFTGDKVNLSNHSFKFKNSTKKCF